MERYINPMLGICRLLLFTMFIPSLLLAQEPASSFEELRRRLMVGDSVQVVDRSGNKIQGRVETVSTSSLAVSGGKGRLVLPEQSVAEVRKKQYDHWWNGALIGAGTGAIAGWIIARRECGGSDPECSAIAGPVFILPGMGIGAVTGALIDRSLTKFATVFRASGPSGQPRVSFFPAITRKHRGVTVAVSF